MNIMLMSVTERTREIGIRKALGAARRDIRRQFFAEALTLSLLGGIAGLAVGAGLAGLVQVLSPLPARVTAWSIGIALALGVVVGVAFGVYPAHRASLLDPSTRCARNRWPGPLPAHGARGLAHRLRSAPCQQAALGTHGARRRDRDCDRDGHGLDRCRLSRANRPIPSRCGPDTFRVLRYFSTTGVNPDAVPREVRIREADAAGRRAIARLPEIHYAAIWTQVFQRSSTAGTTRASSACSGRTTAL